MLDSRSHGDIPLTYSIKDIQASAGKTLIHFFPNYVFRQTYFFGEACNPDFKALIEKRSPLQRKHSLGTECSLAHQGAQRGKI